jgi:hypothetical protein
VCEILNSALQKQAKSLLIVIITLFSDALLAEFQLDFTPRVVNPSQRQSVANIGCSGGVSTVGGHNRSDFVGCGDGTYFMQEIVSDGVNKYYHIIIGDPKTDAFAQEYYIRTAGCCWFTAKGPANNPMFGEAPLSSSYGDTGKLLSSAFFPLAPVTLSGNGAGNPSRIYMTQINQDGDMYLEFSKAFEDKKPRLTQIVDDGEITSEFVLDNSNASYYQSLMAMEYTNKVTLHDGPGKPQSVGNYNVATQAPKQYVTGGLYTYKDGPAVAGSFGKYVYASTQYDPVYINWLAYCSPEENSYRGCVGGPGPGGSGPGGPYANLRAGQETWWAAH